MSRHHDLTGKNSRVGRESIPIELHSAPTLLSGFAASYYVALRNKH